MLVLIGASLTACGGSSAAPSTTTTSTYSLTVPSTNTPTTTAVTSPPGVALPLCAANALKVLSATSQGATTHLVTGVNLTNNSTSPCSLPAPSAIQVIAATGAVLPVEMEQLQGLTFGNLTLQPHGAFGLTTQWRNWCGPPQPPNFIIRIQFGTSGPVFTVPASTGTPPGANSPGCVTPSNGSFIALVQWTTSSSSMPY